MALVVADPSRKPVFAKKLTVRFNDFSGGMNDKFSPLLLADNEVSLIQNFTYDEKGTLMKRKGYLRHYAADFGAGPVLGLYNYRKEDGTSRLIIVCDGKWFYDNPNFNQPFTEAAEFNATGALQQLVDTTAIPGEVRHAKQGGLGFFILGSAWASLGGHVRLKEGIWTSPTMDISTVTDKTTGTVTLGQTLPTNTSITIETRVSPDGVAWDAWLGLGGGNSIQTVGTRTKLQVRARFNSTYRFRASLQSLIVKFDITASVTVLSSGMSTTERWAFATMNDTLWGVDGADTNKKYDGTTFGVQAGSPPICQYVIVHKNYMFLAGNSASNRSRLYFSDLSLPESWPALNFIDVGKGDGDQITGLFIMNDQLTIYKDHSTWVLQGTSPLDFVLRKATDEAGCITGHSVVTAKASSGQMDRNGFFFFDGVRAVIASEKVENAIRGMNQRQLQKAAAVYFRNKIFVSLPEGGTTQLSNNCVLIFDTLRAAWSIFRGINASEWVIWRQQNQDTLLFGSSTKGQVYDMEVGYNDDGAAIDAFVITKAVDFGAAELLSLVRRCLITGKDPQGATVNATASFYQNLGTETATQPLVFDKTLNVLRALPGIVGIGPVHSLAMKIRNNTIDQGLNIYSIAIEYVRKGVRATV
jgi:hypothetical protein